MAQYKLPDGKIIEVPDNTPPEGLQALQTQLAGLYPDYYQPYEPEPERSVLGGLAQAPQGIPRGFLNTTTLAAIGFAEAVDYGEDSKFTADLKNLKAYINGDPSANAEQARITKNSLLTKFSPKIGATSMLADYALDRFGFEDRKSIYDPRIIDPKGTYRGSLYQSVPEGLGSAAAFIGTTAVNPFLGGALAMGTGVGTQAEMQDEARARGEEISLGQEIGSKILGGLIGWSEILNPLRILRIFKGLRKGDPRAKPYVKFLKDTATSAGIEGTQEMFAGYFQDLVAQGIYDPTLEVGESMADDFTVGAIVGGIVGASSSAAHHRIQKNQASDYESSQANELAKQDAEQDEIIKQRVILAKQQGDQIIDPDLVPDSSIDLVNNLDNELNNINNELDRLDAPETFDAYDLIENKEEKKKKVIEDKEKENKLLIRKKAFERVKKIFNRNKGDYTNQELQELIKATIEYETLNAIPVELKNTKTVEESREAYRKFKKAADRTARDEIKPEGVEIPVLESFDFVANDDGSVNVIGKETQQSIGIFPNIEEAARAATEKTKQNRNQFVVGSAEQISNINGLAGNGTASNIARKLYDPLNTLIDAKVLANFDVRVSDKRQQQFKKEKAIQATEDEGYRRLASRLMENIDTSNMSDEDLVNEKEELSKQLSNIQTAYPVENNVVSPESTLGLFWEYADKSGVGAKNFYTVKEAKKLLNKADFNQLMSEKSNIKFKKIEATGELKPVKKIKGKIDVSKKSFDEAFESKNIEVDYNSPAFKYLAETFTGNTNFGNMSVGQKEMLLSHIKSLPRFNNKIKLPNYTPRPYTAEQMNGFYKQFQSNKFTNKDIKLAIKNDITGSDLTLKQIEQFKTDLIDSGRASKTKNRLTMTDDFTIQQARRAESYSNETTDEFKNRLRRTTLLTPEDIEEVVNNDATYKQGVIEANDLLALPSPEPMEKYSNLLDLMKQRLVDRKMGDIAVAFDKNIKASLNIRQKGDKYFYQPVDLDKSKGKPIALYDRPLNKIVASIEAINPDGTMSETELAAELTNQLDHESIHALIQLGVLKQKEFDILLRDAKKLLPRNFQDKLKANYTGVNNKVSEEELNEELVAEFFRISINNPSKLISPKSKTIIDKILNFLTTLGQTIYDAGFISSRTIIRDIESGKIGARERDAPRNVQRLRTINERKYGIARPTSAQLNTSKLSKYSNIPFSRQERESLKQEIEKLDNQITDKIRRYDLDYSYLTNKTAINDQNEIAYLEKKRNILKEKLRSLKPTQLDFPSFSRIQPVELDENTSTLISARVGDQNIELRYAGKDKVAGMSRLDEDTGESFFNWVIYSKPTTRNSAMKPTVRWLLQSFKNNGWQDGKRTKKWKKTDTLEDVANFLNKENGLTENDRGYISVDDDAVGDITIKEDKNYPNAYNGLLSIEIEDKAKNKGIGQAVVAMVASTNPDIVSGKKQLEIFDITPEGRPFWEAIGTKVTYRSGSPEVKGSTDLSPLDGKLSFPSAIEEMMLKDIKMLDELEDQPSFSRAATDTSPAYMDLSRKDISTFVGFDEYRVGGEKIPNAFVMRLPIDTFLNLTTQGPQEINKIKEEVKKEFAKFDPAKVDNKIYPIFLNINNEGKVTGHEGRHRAALLQLEGAQTIPVVVAIKKEPNITELKDVINNPVDIGINRLSNQYDNGFETPLLSDSSVGPIAMVRRFNKDDIDYALQVANAPDTQTQDIPSFSRGPRDESSGMAADYYAPTRGPRASDLLEDVDGDGFSPSDIYQNPQFYTAAPPNARDPEQRTIFRETLAFMGKLRQIKGDPDATIIMYRAAPTNELREGDLLTPSKTEAQGYVDASEVTIEEGRKAERARMRQEQIDKEGAVNLSQEKLYNQMDELRDIFGKPAEVTPSQLFTYELKAGDVRWDGNQLERWGYYPSNVVSIDGDTPSFSRVSDIENKYINEDIKLDIFETENEIKLSKIIVSEKNMGVGTSVMNDLTNYADINNKVITLTPSKDFGATSVNRLKTFYKRFGFVENKGRNKDFSYRDSMYRLPQISQDTPSFSRINSKELYDDWRRETNNPKTFEQTAEEFKEYKESLPSTMMPRWNEAASPIAIRAGFDYQEGIEPVIMTDAASYSRSDKEIPDKYKDIDETINGDNNTPDETFADAIIDIAETKEEVGGFLSRMRAQAIDDMSIPEKTLIKLGKASAKIRELNSRAITGAIQALRWSKKGRAINSQAMVKGVPVLVDEKGNPVPKGTKGFGGTKVLDFKHGGYVQILGQLHTTAYGEDLMRLFKMYRIGIRGTRLNKEGKEVVLTAEQLKLAKEIGEDFPIIKIVSKQYSEYNNAILDYAVQTGILSEEITINQLIKNITSSTKKITKKQLQKLRNEARENGFTDEQFRQELLTLANDTNLNLPEGKKIDIRGTAEIWRDNSDYYPFYRKMADNTIQGPSIAGGFLTGNPLGIEIKGSKKAIEPEPLEVIARNIQSIITAAMKNEGLSRLMAVYEEGGLAKKILPKDQKEARNMGSDVISVFENGEKIYYQIADPIFTYGLQALGMTQDASAFMKVIGLPSNILRESITRDPGFIIKNMLRDTLSASVTSGADFIPIVATFKGFASDLSELERFGIIGGYDAANDRQDIVKKINKIKKEQGLDVYDEEGNFAIDQVVKLWDIMGGLTTKSDGSTRKAVADTILALTGDQVEAAYQGLEIINFDRRGFNPYMRIVTTAIPFLNARIQGLDVLYRSGTGQYSSKISEIAKNTTPDEQAKSIILTHAFRGGLLMLATGLYYALMGDEERYKEERQSVRDDNWLIPMPFDLPPAKFPIPFEIGFIYKTIPERIVDYSMTELDNPNYGNTTGKQLEESITRGITTTLKLDPFAWQLIKPIKEVMNNKSSFTGNPIVPPFMEKGIEPQLQSTINTSSFAIALGKATNTSPIKIDYILKGYTGTIGTYVLNMADTGVRQATGRDYIAPYLTQLPIAKSLFASPIGGGLQEQFYEMRTYSNMVTQTINKLEKEGRKDELIAFMQSHKGAISTRDEVLRIDRFMEKYRKDKLSIQIDKRLSAKQKQEIIERLDRDRNLRLAIVPFLVKQTDQSAYLSGLIRN
jgi:hypothetical protein